MDITQYLKGRPNYYVDDCFSCEDKNIEYLFVLESPHKKEVESQTPLMGTTGKAVSRYLFGDEKKEIPFGEIIKENKVDLKIGIINVSNVPLQNLADIPNGVFPEEIEDIRNKNKIDPILYGVFKNKMDTYAFRDLKKLFCVANLQRYILINIRKKSLNLAVYRF